jgi:uncharacterized membrane protein
MSEHGKSVFDLDANLVALLCYLGNFVCYLGLILSIIVVIQDKDNKLARFHAWQSIILSIAAVVVTIILYIGVFVGAVIDSAIGLPIISGLAFLLILAFSLGLLVMIILAAIKGFGGEMYKIPVVGNMAEKYA